MLAGVGCFGSCFQEPLVNVRLPVNSLVVLHRVQACPTGALAEKGLAVMEMVKQSDAVSRLATQRAVSVDGAH